MSRFLLRGLGAVALMGCAHAPLRVVPSPGSDRERLRFEIDSLLGAPVFRNARFGVLVVDPERADTLYSRDAGKLFMPASNMKIVTGAVALAELGEDFRFRTSFVARGDVRDGALAGDLAVVGRGDPSVSDAMRHETMMPLLAMADSLVAHGIHRVAGKLVRGGDAFPGPTLGYGWDWDDLDYSYGAAVDELLLNEGIARLLVHGGASAGAAVTVTTAPATRYPRVRALATTIAAGTKPRAGDEPRAWWDSAGGVTVAGAIAAGDTSTVEVAYRDPGAAYLAALAEALASRGVAVALGVDAGTDSTLTARSRADTIVTVWSPPLREIMPALEKPSQNQIAEMLLRTIGLERTGVGLPDSGARVAGTRLVSWGAPADGFVIHDGSGLSRHDYLSPETIVHVLDAMRHHPSFRAFYDALPIAGVDGTIATRMRNTPAANNVHAKTGTIDRGSSLSGYVTTADGRTLLFSILTNNWTTTSREPRRVQDAIASRLAALHLSH